MPFKVYAYPLEQLILFYNPKLIHNSRIPIGVIRVPLKYSDRNLQRLHLATNRNHKRLLQYFRLSVLQFHTPKSHASTCANHRPFFHLCCTVQASAFCCFTSVAPTRRSWQKSSLVGRRLGAATVEYLARGT